MKRIEFGEVRIGNIARTHLSECIENNWVTCGPKVDLLERKWAELFNQKHAICTSSGTTADTAALMCLYALGAKRGDKIIIPSLCFFSVASSVLMAGFVPIFCDIDRYTLNINETLLEDLIAQHSNVVGIIAVTTMGKPFNAPYIQAFAKKHNLFLIGDNCEGVACRYNNKLIEEYVDITTVSMFSAHLIFSAEMGCCSTNNDRLSELLYAIRSHGRPKGTATFNHLYNSGNFKPTDLHASIGLESIDNFKETFNIRKQNWIFLTESLSRWEDKIILSKEDHWCENSPHGVAITLKQDNSDNFEKLQQHMMQANIETKLTFKCLPTQQPALEFLGYKLGQFPEAEFVGRNSLHIGCHRYLSQENLEYIISTIENFIEKILI